MKKIIFGLCAVMMCSSVYAMQTQSVPKNPKQENKPSKTQPLKIPLQKK